MEYDFEKCDILTWKRVFELLSSSLLLFPSVSADMSSGLLQVFVELGSLYGTSNHVLYLIHGFLLF